MSSFNKPEGAKIMNSSEVNLGGIPVGDKHPVVFMAEFSTFFNQDIELAFSYIQKAVAAGVDVIKSEVLHDPNVCLRTDLIHHYNHAKGSSWRWSAKRINSLNSTPMFLKGRLSLPTITPWGYWL